MELTPWTVYWITRLDSALDTASIATVLVTVAFIICSCVYLTDKVEGRASQPVERAWYGLMGLLSFLTLIITFVPTTKEFAAIIVLPALAQNQDIKDIGAEIPKLALEWLQELHPKQKD